ncbi:hypothetical protein LXA43DRAFT_1131901 [Ganoderma leucocontextum]|nr:hypothetical protein LXA43DRAFT_1131901 [Ganoderma leucocontextum]
MFASGTTVPSQVPLYQCGLVHFVSPLSSFPFTYLSIVHQMADRPASCPPACACAQPLRLPMTTTTINRRVPSNATSRTTSTFGPRMTCHSPSWHLTAEAAHLCALSGSAAAAALVVLLSRMEPSARFASLELDGDRDAKDFLSSGPGLPGAFAYLTTLKIVRIDSVGKLGADMLKSTLVSALELCSMLGDDEPTSTRSEVRCMSNPAFLLLGSYQNFVRFQLPRC